ncbi:MAG TPA: hypothetical protein VEP49_14620 [Acidimicrobiia bacterium]|nr:hypothetical protein [Acidimicrobiia bacterium]
MTAMVPPPPLPRLEEPQHVEPHTLAVPRWLVATVIVLVSLLLLGAAFAGGYVARGPGAGERASTAVPTSCSAADILGVVRDWSNAVDKWDRAPADTPEEDQAYNEMTDQEQRLKNTLVRCS